MNFKDLFSMQSSDYAKFRPTYPETLFKYLASISPERKLVWDCGTGNGQAAIELSKYFEKVIASDPSSKQIELAPRRDNVQYEIGTAENTNLKEHSLDLITVAQAFHWFKHDIFAQVCKRALKSGGHLAVWSYALAYVTPEIDQVVLNFYQNTLKNCWEPERLLVENGYQSLKMPFVEIEVPKFEMKTTWSFEHFIGYLNTWSAVQTYIKKYGQNPLEREFEDLKEAWGNIVEREISWPLNIRIWII